MKAQAVPMMRVSRAQAVNYRLAVNNLSRRLPAGSYAEAAYAGLQDTAPRDALLGLHARVTACEPSAWEHPQLIQTYSPRAAVYVLPRDDFGVFTVGRLPRDPVARQDLEDRAERVCQELAGQPQPARGLQSSRDVCATGRSVDHQLSARLGASAPAGRHRSGKDRALPPPRPRLRPDDTGRVRLVGRRVSGRRPAEL
jgi:hypothetical protein